MLGWYSLWLAGWLRVGKGEAFFSPMMFWQIKILKYVGLTLVSLSIVTDLLLAARLILP